LATWSCAKELATLYPGTCGATTKVSLERGAISLVDTTPERVRRCFKYSRLQLHAVIDSGSHSFIRAVIHSVIPVFSLVGVLSVTAALVEDRTSSILQLHAGSWNKEEIYVKLSNWNKTSINSNVVWKTTAICWKGGRALLMESGCGTAK